MSLYLKMRTTNIILILLINIFTVSIIIIPPTKSNDIFDDFALEDLLEYLQYADDFFGGLSDLHPFRFVCYWNYEEMNITEVNGDIEFDFYYTSPVITQIESFSFKDKMNFTIYHQHIDENFEYKTEKVVNGQKQITLEPDFLSGSIQQSNIQLEDINLTLSPGDTLIFVNELIPSDKPLGNIVGQQFEKRLKDQLNLAADTFNQSGNPELENLSGLIYLFLEFIDLVGITNEDIVQLVSAMISSSLVYGSTDYPTNIKIPTNTDDYKTLYFKDDSFEQITIADESKPVQDIESFDPPKIINPENLTFEADVDVWGEWLLFLAIYVVSDNIIQTPEENQVTYYLLSNEELSENKPSTGRPNRISISSEPIKWTSPTRVGHRNKIITNISAEIYIYSLNIFSLSPITIQAVITNKNDIQIARDQQQFYTKSIDELIGSGPETLLKFSFKNFTQDYEFWYDDTLTLKLNWANKQSFNLISPKILYNSSANPSKVIYYYNETDNIKIESLEDKSVIPGGDTKFLLNITSKYDDNLDIEVDKLKEVGIWEIQYLEEIEIKENQTISLPVSISSKSDSSSSFDKDEINLIFNVTGQTGIDSEKADVRVEKSAVVYDIDVIAPDGKRINHGRKTSYKFIIRNNNTGFLEDTYSIFVESEHDWETDYIQSISNLPVYDGSESNEGVVIVNLTIPWYTSVTSDELAFTVISENSKLYSEELSISVNITTKIERANIFENIYHLFETASEKIGLDNSIGAAATWVLISLILLIIIILLLLAIIVLRRNYVSLICLDRVKYINPDETAEFEITVINPYKKTLEYDISIQTTNNSNGWEFMLSNTHLTIETKKSQKIKFIVKSNDCIKSDDWLKSSIVAKPIGKRKKAKIELVTSLKEAKLSLDIDSVYHWPQLFKKGERVETKFKLVNRGNVASNNVSIILYINGIEKNKVEEVNIPRGGYADIEMPWIAEKGKNELYIVVK
jgi:hypothetical protein